MLKQTKCGTVAVVFSASLVLQAILPPLACSDNKANASRDPRARSPVAPAMEVTGRGITARLKDAPLVKVLEILAQKTDARIVFYGATENTVTAEFSNLRLEEGLRRLFLGRNLAYFYSSPAPGKRRRLEQVLILEPADAITREPPFSSTSDPGRQDKPGSEGIPPGAADEEGAITELAEVLSEAKDGDARAEAAKQLGKTWNEEAIAPLAQAVSQDDRAAVRQAAADALGRTWSEKAVPPLVDALINDPDALVREQAARSLAQTADEEAVAGLAQALEGDRRWFVREAAAFALATIGGRNALDALLQASQDDRDAWVRETAAAAVLESR
jgi:HEAT repeats/PBS lyase HEAT-like repeat